ncbi:2-oxoglutarate dehydrogenase- E1 component [Striga hermonthica]|uniref:2-oxoglutarate dehydrogenase- E1 component n=1 Tax=Striga hermonthica TaxID=68872 RepID=A0A9N7NAF9_STRHE|nr:2-oxoglutarate dehydrogenase- E1 component [Striga hermonthica]
MIETEEGIDWAVGEALAFATLLVEGNHVRLCGQDVERGTFSHRHSFIHDQETGERYDHVMMNQDEELFTVSNSSLSEFGVLGFELGYSMENPNSVVLWEAQFGDFSNGAQMSDDNPYVIPEMDPTFRKQIQECNWQVVNVTTPANYFHVLRRQIHMEFRKPLIVMSPKNLLRHKDCQSNLSEFDDGAGHPCFNKQGTRFKRLMKDQNYHSDLEEGIRRLILCSERKKIGGKDIAICRVEQLCLFPYDLDQRELKRYPNGEIVCVVPGRANEHGCIQLHRASSWNCQALWMKSSTWAAAHLQPPLLDFTKSTSKSKMRSSRKPCKL